MRVLAARAAVTRQCIKHPPCAGKSLQLVGREHERRVATWRLEQSVFAAAEEIRARALALVTRMKQPRGGGAGHFVVARRRHSNRERCDRKSIGDLRATRNDAFHGGWALCTVRAGSSRHPHLRFSE